MDISVITPFYKGNAYMEGLFSCIRGCAQAAPELSVELILVNDSPDCQVAYDPQWVQGFTLTLLTNAQNSGIHRSRVNGLQAAQGTFIQFLDQDDLLAPETFASQFPLAQEADVVIANGFDQNPNTYGPIYKSLDHQKQAAKPRFYCTVGNQIVSPGHTLIRKSAIPEAWCTGFIQRNGSDDLLLWLMLFAQKARFAINPAQLYTHVETGVNVSADLDKILASSLEVLAFLQERNMICAKNSRRFRRSRNMSRLYTGKGKLKKLLAMLLYPDVAWERLVLQLYKKT